MPEQAIISKGDGTGTEGLRHDVIEVTCWQLIQERVQIADMELAILFGQLVSERDQACELRGRGARAADDVPTDA